jgi:hypothetical protein
MRRRPDQHGFAQGSWPKDMGGWERQRRMSRIQASFQGAARLAQQRAVVLARPSIPSSLVVRCPLRRQTFLPGLTPRQLSHEAARLQAKFDAISTATALRLTVAGVLVTRCASRGHGAGKRAGTQPSARGGVASTSATRVTYFRHPPRRRAYGTDLAGTSSLPERALCDIAEATLDSLEIVSGALDDIFTTSTTTILERI